MHHDEEETRDEELFEEKLEELGGLQLPVCGHWLFGGPSGPYFPVLHGPSWLASSNGLRGGH